MRQWAENRTRRPAYGIHDPRHDRSAHLVPVARRRTPPRVRAVIQCPILTVQQAVAKWWRAVGNGWFRADARGIDVLSYACKSPIFRDNSTVAHEYVKVDRNQQFLLPPDMNDWLPRDHLVWVIIDVVEALDTSGLDRLHPRDGVGRPAYHPDMMLTLLFYAYCRGQQSSRRIEELCGTDIAYRVASANTVPDHATIARFRVQYRAVAESLFCDMLMICDRAGLVNAGIVAVDGTKLFAVAALRANRTRAQIDAELAEIAAKVFADADAGDAPSGAERQRDSNKDNDRDRRGGRDRTLERDGRRERLTQANVELALARADAARDAAQREAKQAALRPRAGCYADVRCVVKRSRRPKPALYGHTKPQTRNKPAPRRVH